MAFIPGTPLSDNLSGTPEDDEILGFAGDDTLAGGGGIDFVHGGSGKDVLVGRDGDLLNGGVGNDRFFVGAAFTQPVLTANGDAGDDSFESISTFDPGQSVFNFGLDLDGGLGNDAFDFALIQASIMDGGHGNDRFTIDRMLSGMLTGGEGQDQFQVRFMLGHIWAGDGNDVISVGIAETGGTVLRGENGNDVISSGVGSAVIEGGAGNDRLSDGLDFNDLPSRLDGGAGNDVLRSPGLDDLSGGDGRDALESGGFANTLTGGAGADRFVYGTFDFTSIAGDTITDFGNGRDILDLSRLLDQLGAPDDPFTSGFLDLDVQNGSTRVLIDMDGGGDNFGVLAMLQNTILDESFRDFLIL
jgi:Ca2+-binding RTX toxin-like protein